MKLIKACALVALCLLSVTACVEDDRRDRRSNDDDDEVVVIGTEDRKEDGSSKPSKSCSPFDKDCKEEEDDETPMMSSEDGEFTIYHITQGACGEAERIFKGCDKSTPDMTLREDFNSDFCIREDYDAARCFIEHSTEVCKMVDSDWEYYSESLEECIDDAYEARACDALTLKFLSCDGEEYHELPEEYKTDSCTAEDRQIGECVIDYSDDVCAFYYWAQVDPDHEFEPGENLFHDCLANL